jgi:hypothetical protein
MILAPIGVALRTGALAHTIHAICSVSPILPNLDIIWILVTAKGFFKIQDNGPSK